jgi:hypothetical protein
MTKITMYAKSRTSPFNRTMTTSRQHFEFRTEWGDIVCESMMWPVINGYSGRIFPPTKGRLELSYQKDEQA